jgi:hypothetical protein
MFSVRGSVLQARRSFATFGRGRAPEARLAGKIGWPHTQGNVGGKKTLAAEIIRPHIAKCGMERGAAPDPLPVRA